MKSELDRAIDACRGLSAMAASWLCRDSDDDFKDSGVVLAVIQGLADTKMHTLQTPEEEK